jgi:Family of unknown function (DUF6518)
VIATARSSASLAAIAVGAGAVLGAAALLIAQLPHPFNLLATLGGPWIATAFAVGTFARRRRPAALAGAASMVSAVVAYYAMREVVHPGAPGGFTVGGQIGPYLLIALVAGPVFGALGSAWGSGGTVARIVGPGLLAGALGAEVIVLTVQAWTGVELVWAVLQGGAAVAVALVLPGSRRAARLALVLGIVSAATVSAVILSVDLKLRLFG